MEGKDLVKIAKHASYWIFKKEMVLRIILIRLVDADN